MFVQYPVQVKEVLNTKRYDELNRKYIKLLGFQPNILEATIINLHAMILAYQHILAIREGE